MGAHRRSPQIGRPSRGWTSSNGGSLSSLICTNSSASTSSPAFFMTGLGDGLLCAFATSLTAPPHGWVLRFDPRIGGGKWLV